MLRPTKHADLRTTTLNVGAAILHAIRTQGRASITEIESIVRKRCGDVGPRRLQEAILVLHAIGALDYSQNLDAFVAGRQRARRAA